MKKTREEKKAIAETHKSDLETGEVSDPIAILKKETENYL